VGCWCECLWVGAWFGDKRDVTRETSKKYVILRSGERRLDQMGRPRKPQALHEMNGTFEKHPERRRANEPKPEGPIGPPPPSFNPDLSFGREHIALWHEVVSQVPPGVLTSSDRMHVEIICRLMYRVRHQIAKAGEFARLESMLAKMGMNPSDRSKVNLSPVAAPGPKGANGQTENRFAAIAALTARQPVN
jgi:hypothetical protein